MRCPFCGNPETRDVGAGTFECVERLVWVFTDRGEPVFAGCRRTFTLADVELVAERLRGEAAAKQAQQRARQALLESLERSSDVGEIHAALRRAEQTPSEARTFLPAAVGAWCRLASAGLIGPPSHDLVDIEGHRASFGSMMFRELSRRPLWSVQQEASLWLVDAEGAAWRTTDAATEVSTWEQRRFEQRTVQMTFVVTTGAPCEVSSRVERGTSFSGDRGWWRRSAARHGRTVDRAALSLPILLMLLRELQQSGGRCPHCGAPHAATLLVLPGVARCGRCCLRFRTAVA
ncbi:MAG TPA: hypothetical protein VFU94_10430 [Conexibacter sp.]|nr:hypothetical protein [Conexibacter sp.]